MANVKRIGKKVMRHDVNVLAEAQLLWDKLAPIVDDFEPWCTCVKGTAVASLLADVIAENAVHLREAWRDELFELIDDRLREKLN